MKRFFAFIVLACFAIAMGLMFIGCGSRKTAKSNTETYSTLDRKVETKTAVSIQGEKMTYSQAVAIFDLKNTLTDESEILAPLLSDKPIVKTETIDGNTKTTTWHNAKVEISKKSQASSDNSVVTKNDSVIERTKSDLTENVKSNVKAKTETKSFDKSTERESLSMWWWFLLLVPVFGVYIYYRFR